MGHHTLIRTDGIPVNEEQSVWILLGDGSESVCCYYFRVDEIARCSRVNHSSEFLSLYLDNQVELLALPCHTYFVMLWVPRLFKYTQRWPSATEDP